MKPDERLKEFELLKPEELLALCDFQESIGLERIVLMQPENVINFLKYKDDREKQNHEATEGTSK
jgi:hypothetical protein